jgi:hypothetical protein
MNVSGRKRFDPIPLARALFKVGLGLVAYDSGRDVALQGRYDAARRFILEGEPIGTQLLMARRGQPRAEIRTGVHPSESGTLIVLDLFGLEFAFNLEPFLLVAPNTGAADDFAVYWLGAVQPSAAPDVRAESS